MLSTSEIKELVDTVKQVFAYIQHTKAENPIASFIQYPKIPKALSESICFHLLQKKLLLKDILFKDIIINTKIADLTLKTDSKDIHVEIKATGISAFQNLGVKDINADYLIWMHFNTYFFKDSNNSIEIYVVENPNQYFSSPAKITLKDFKQRVSSLVCQTIDLDLVLT